MPVDLAEIREIFFEESVENLNRMESNLLELEKGTVDSELINSIFRGAHSIKGGAGIFNFEEIIAFAHIMETLLDDMRHEKQVITPSVIDLLLRSVDALRMMLLAVKEESDYDVQEVQACQNELKNVLNVPTKKSDEKESLEEESDEKATSESSKSSESSELKEPATSDTSTTGWHIVFKPNLSMLKTGNDPINLFDELKRLGDLEVKVDISQIPTFSDLDVQACHLSWELILRADVKLAALEEIFDWVEDECELHITALEEFSSPQETESPLEKSEEFIIDKCEGAVNQIEQPIPHFKKETNREEISQLKTAPIEHKKKVHHQTEANSIRVSINKIDDLINMVGELVITQSMLEQFGDNFDSSRISQLRDGLSQLERNSRELQESVMRIRMLPISYSFNRFPRLVHDLSLQLSKKVELKLSGEHTELDKTVLEKMSDPLVHLVRNALDHGIETPVQRQAAGKSETGELRLHAFHQGGNIIIQISDDGAGFDLDKIRAKAIQQDLLNPDDHPSEEELYDLIFQPGFTTVEEVSNLSGRGVGMDVVRRNIRALGGTIHVESKQGEGSTFNVRLPLTLAILDGQLVRVGQEIYILSLLSIIESLRVQTKLVNSYGGSAEVYKLRDEYIPILRLYDLFDIIPSTTQLEQGILVIAEGEGQKIGLFVDELLSQQQIVIKSLESNYKKIQGIFGATILGNGSVALILDVAGLIQRFHHIDFQEN